jgi:hypothetical protein
MLGVLLVDGSGSDAGGRSSAGGRPYLCRRYGVRPALARTSAHRVSCGRLLNSGEMIANRYMATVVVSATPSRVERRAWTHG